MANLKLTNSNGGQTSITADKFIGNTSTASKWLSARTLTLTGAVTGSTTIDGSGNITLNAVTNHNHDSLYVNITGDTMSGGLRITSPNLTTIDGLIDQIPLATTGGYVGANGIAFTNPATRNDMGWIRVTGTSESDTVLEIATGDDAGAGEAIVVRQYNTSNAIAKQANLLDASGNTYFPGSVTASSFIGNASSATYTSSSGNADTLDGYHHDAFLKLSGGTMSAPILFTASATSGPDISTPTALSYGRLQAYGNLFINANTDNSGTEYCVITAGKGMSSSASDGLAIGSNSLTWLNNNIIHAGNYASYCQPKHLSASANLSTAGWYKILTGTYTTLGETILIRLGREYNYADSEGYLIAINKAYWQGKIKVLSGQKNIRGFSAIGLYWESDNTYSVWVYYILSNLNSCYIDVIERPQSSSITVHNFVKGSPTGSQIGYTELTYDVTHNSFFSTDTAPTGVNYFQPGDVWYKLI